MADRQYVTQLGRPAIDKAFNGLRTVTRISDVNASGTVAASIEAEVFLAYATADPEFALALLVKRGMQQVSVDKSAYVGRLTEVYQEFTAGQKVSVGEDQILLLEDGRTALVRRYVALASEAEGLAAAIGDVLGSRACQDVKINKQGVGAEIVETYISAGLLSESNAEDNNGKLLLKTLVHFNEVPPTPVGYTLKSTNVKDPDGIPTYSYQFAKGDGQISYDPSSDNNGALLKVAIRHLTAPGASNPIATPGGYTLVSGPTFQEADGHMIWSARFAKGDGEISRRTSRSQAGTTTDGTIGVSRLDIDYLTAPAAVEPTWADVSGYTKIVVTSAERDGHMVWSAIYAKGVGLVAQSIGRAAPGLRRVTNHSLGTKVTPDGIVDQDDYRLADGYTVYTTSAVQTAAGGADPTSITVATERYVSFTYPGRAKAFTETYDGKLMLSSFLSPPVTTQVKATVTVSYVTGTTLGTISDFWNPSDWATIKKQWVGSYGKQTSEIRALPGYRSVSATPVTYTGSGSDSAIEGSVIYAGTTARITITGGPADPGGGTWTLDAEIDPEPVFTSTAGTKYYRKTVITAAIPAQAALPV